jgi:hypothetical protein
LNLAAGTIFRDEEEKPLAQYSDCYEISFDIGRDVLTRNLYMLFKTISYSNGIKIINGLHKCKLPWEKRISIGRADEKQQRILEEYQSWDDNKIYIVDLRAEKNRYGKGYIIREFSPFNVKKTWIDAGVVCENFYGNLSEDYYKRLDKVFLQHGYEIS